MLIMLVILVIVNPLVGSAFIWVPIWFMGALRNMRGVSRSSRRSNTVNLPTQLVLYPNFVLCLLTFVNLCLLLSFGVIILAPFLLLRTHHVDVDCHYVCEQVVAQTLHVGVVASLDQNADVFTKGLSLPRFSSSISKLHFIPRSLCLRRGREGRGGDKPKEATDSNTGK